MNRLVKFISVLGFTILAAACNPSTKITSPGGGYTHDTSTNIVVGAGYEWLRWDVSAGMSIEELNTYASSGWELASNQQIADLFNDFQFGYWFDATIEDQTIDTEEEAPNISGNFLLFTSMFGGNSEPDCPRCWFSAAEISHEDFGSGSSLSLVSRMAYVSHKIISSSGEQEHVLQTASLRLIPNLGSSSLGRALVRPTTATEY